MTVPLPEGNDSVGDGRQTRGLLHASPLKKLALVARSGIDEGGLGASGLLALAMAALGLVVLVVQGRALIEALYVNPDFASPPMIASLIGDAPNGRLVTLGNY